MDSVTERDDKDNCINAENKVQCNKNRTDEVMRGIYEEAGSHGGNLRRKTIYIK